MAKRKCLDAGIQKILEREQTANPKKKLKTFHFVKLSVRIESLLDQLHPLTFHDKPTTAGLETFEQWSSMFGQSVEALKKLKNDITTIGFHEDFVSSISTRRLKKQFPEEIWCAFRKEWNNESENRFSRRRFELIYNQLKSLGGPIDNIGNVTVEAAFDFCIVTQEIVPSRVQLLKITGFTQHSELVSKIEMLDRFHNFKQLFESKVTFKQYKIVYDFLNTTPKNLGNNLPCNIVDGVKSMPNNLKIPALKVISSELTAQGKTSLLEQIVANGKWNLTKNTNWDNLLLLSEWHTTLLCTALKRLVERSKSKTFFIASVEKTLKGKLASCFLQIQKFAFLQHKNDMKDDDEPLRWFVQNCDNNMITKMLVFCGNNMQLKNEFVKSSVANYSNHPAIKLVGFYLTVLKHGIHDHLKNKNAMLATLKISDVISQIENKRIPANPEKRRVFTDSEVEALLEICKNNAKLTLLLTILREIGLRMICISHIKYYMLLDETHTPREVCSVPEKQKNYRQFLTSMNLRSKIKSYADRIRLELPQDQDFTNFYLFNHTKPHLPYCIPSFRKCLLKMAKAANIVEVRVHPHAFRHTIVGKLMEAGNSIDVVSKFMGHKSTATTSTHYWVASIKELNSMMNNPFTGTLQKKQIEDKENILEIDLLKTKIEQCRQIIFNYNEIIHRCVQENSPIHNIPLEIFSKMPDLKKTLQLINESISSGSSSKSKQENDEKESICEHKESEVNADRQTSIPLQNEQEMLEEFNEESDEYSDQGTKSNNLSDDEFN